MGLTDKRPHIFFMHAYAYRPNIEFSTLNLELILRFFHRSLFFSLCFLIAKNIYIKVLFTNYYSFVNMSFDLFHE